MEELSEFVKFAVGLVYTNWLNLDDAILTLAPNVVPVLLCYPLYDSRKD